MWNIIYFFINHSCIIVEREDFLLVLFSIYCRMSTDLYHLFLWCNYSVNILYIIFCCKYSWTFVELANRPSQITLTSRIVLWYCNQYIAEVKEFRSLRLEIKEWKQDRTVFILAKCIMLFNLCSRYDAKDFDKFYRNLFSKYICMRRIQTLFYTVFF